MYDWVRGSGCDFSFHSLKFVGTLACAFISCGSWHDVGMVGNGWEWLEIDRNVCWGPKMGANEFWQPKREGNACAVAPKCVLTFENGSWYPEMLEGRCFPLRNVLWGSKRVPGLKWSGNRWERPLYNGNACCGSIMC